MARRNITCSLRFTADASKYKTRKFSWHILGLLINVAIWGNLYASVHLARSAETPLNHELLDEHLFHLNYIEVQIMAKEHMNLDQRNLVTVGEIKDGGDTCANEMTLAYAIRRDPKIFINQLNGTPKRHPDPSRWYGAKEMFSRDQLIPLLAAVLAHKDISIWWIIKWHAQRLFLFASNTRNNYQYPTRALFERAKRRGHIGQNVEYDGYKWKLPDITGPEVWALYIRALGRRCWGFKVLYPLLYIFDIETLFGTMAKNESDSRIHRNHVLILHAGLEHMPTFWMKLANSYYDHDKAIKDTYAHYAPDAYPSVLAKVITDLIRDLRTSKELK